MSTGLANATFRTLSQDWEIPEDILDKAWSARLADERASNSAFSCDVLKHENLELSAVVHIAEQLYRHRSCEDLLGAILTGRFSQILVAVMLAAMSRPKFRKAEKEFSHVRTSFSVPRNLWAESENMASWAHGVLFNAESKIRMMPAVHFVGLIHQTPQYGIKWDSREKWYRFRCLDTMTNDTPLFAARMDDEDLQNLQTVISHNRENSQNPERWQFTLWTVRDNSRLSSATAEPINTIVRVKKSLRARGTSCIIGSFAAAVFRWMVLEFGHSRDFDELVAESSVGRPAEFIPLEYVDALRPKATPFQNRILDTCGLDFVESAADTLDVLQRHMVKPPKKDTFYREFNGLMEMVRGMLLREGIVMK